MARNKGSGSIHKRNGKFEGAIRFTVNGKRRSKYFYGEKKSAVENQIRQFQRQQEEQGKNSTSAAAPITVGDHFTQWVAGATSWSPNTRQLMESTLRTHIKDDAIFYALYVANVTTKDINDFFDRKPNSVTNNTKLRIHRMLVAGFNDALQQVPPQITVNPAKLPTTKRIKVDDEPGVKPFTPEDRNKLLAHVANDVYWNALCLFGFDTGCRMQEVLGLQIHNMDLLHREVKIRTALNTIGGVPVLSTVLKTKKSKRELTLAKTTCRAVDAHLRQINPQSGYVFLDPNGRPWTRTNFSKAWTRLLKQAGVPHLGFHSVRHTCATELLKGGAYITAVSTRLGHKRPSMTLDVYSFAISDDQHVLADAFDAAIAKVGAKVGSLSTAK